ncbi:hypothetical protein ACQPZA_34565 [Pseudonocardia xinjiangensis]|uniref:hypothetical protein n=1 Tax=Pseudonocardia xinjiangensis TaxID=75289 RepID=UPI003D93834D
MEMTTAPARRGRVLYGVALVLTIPLSLVTALFGVGAGGMFALCYDSGASSAANRCAAVGEFLVVACLATLLVPVVFGIWGRRATTLAQVAARLGICLLGYVVPLLFFAAVTLL